jgi:hypothetical protein
VHDEPDDTFFLFKEGNLTLYGSALSPEAAAPPDFHFQFPEDAPLGWRKLLDLARLRLDSHYKPSAAMPLDVITGALVRRCALWRDAGCSRVAAPYGGTLVGFASLRLMAGRWLCWSVCASLRLMAGRWLCRCLVG